MKLELQPIFTQEGEEKFILALVDNIARFGIEMMRTFADSPKLGKMCQGNGGPGYTNGNWNYIPSNYWGLTYILAQRLGVKKFLDIGSGLGIGPYTCELVQRMLNHRKILWQGVEQYKELANVSNRWGIPTIVKDIFALTKADIADYDCLFMYEPAASPENAERMVNHIVSIMGPHQTLLHQCAGKMGYCFDHHPDLRAFDRDEKYYHLKVYKLAEKQTPGTRKKVAGSRQARRRATAVHK